MIQQEIEKYALKLAGKDKQIRFSPKVIQVPMSLWMQLPAAYEDLRNSGWIITLPSQSRLKLLHQETKVKDGECVLLYCRYAAHTPRESTPGHIKG